MSNASVGFGIIGLGMGHARARQLVKTEGARLVAVSDLLEARGRAAEKEFGCPWHPDYRQMLERKDLDVVLVMTPSGLHAALGRDAAAAGKHVVVTKPMDVTLENARALIEACKQARVTLAVDFECRYMPDVCKTKRAVEEGLFGALILGEARLKWWRGAKYYEGWHGTWKLDGGGSLMNQTVHNVDVLQWIMGDVESVTAQYGVFAHKIETEDLTAALLRFRSGAMGTLLATTTYPTSAPTRMEFHGTKGAAVIEGNGLHSWYAKKDFEETIPAPNPESFAYTYDGPRHIFEDMVRVVRDGAAPAVDGTEGCKSLEIVLAAYRSAQTGKTVKLPLKAARAARK